MSSLSPIDSGSLRVSTRTVWNESALPAEAPARPPYPHTLSSSGAHEAGHPPATVPASGPGEGGRPRSGEGGGPAEPALAIEQALPGAGSPAAEWFGAFVEPAQLLGRRRRRRYVFRDIATPLSQKWSHGRKVWAVLPSPKGVSRSPPLSNFGLN